MKKCYQIVRTAKSPDPYDQFWGIGQEVGPIGEPICVDVPPLVFHPDAFSFLFWGTDQTVPLTGEP